MGTLHIGHIRNALNKRFMASIDMSDISPNTPPAQRNNQFLTRSLSAFAIAELANIDDRVAAAGVVDGDDDDGIDAFYFDVSDHTCYLVQSKWDNTGKHSINVGDTLKFLRGVNHLLNSTIDQFGKLKTKKHEIEQALSDSEAKFILIIAYTGEPDLAPEVRMPIEELLHAQNDVSELISYRVLRQSDLHSMVAKKAHGEAVNFEIALQEWGIVGEPYRAYYGQVHLEDIVKWKQYGQALFSKNLRGFKGSTEVNEGIIATARSSPSDFWYFNNGITVLCNSVVKKPLGGSSRTAGTFDCRGVSVVNGAQTVGSIIAAADGGTNSFNNATVLIRLISLEGCPPNFSRDLTNAANTQNRIEKKDFAALDPQQSRLRTELLLEVGKEYSFRSGDRVPLPEDGCTLDEAAVALACAQPDVTLAVTAKATPGRLYDDVAKPPYTALFNPSVSAREMWRSVRILRLVDDALKARRQELYGKDRYIAIHGNRFVLHMVFRALPKLDGQDFDQDATRIPELTDTILKSMTSKIAEKFPNTYAGNLFKNNTKCKELATSLGEPTMDRT
ncbi:AIPR family protein [bacterium]|nr:AIPR family protein [bacterium]